MIGCLFLHGFTGSPFEVEPLVTYVKEHTSWIVSCPFLPGHEEDGSLKGVKYTEWIHAAEQALVELQKQCETIYVIGFSMGGMIAAYLASVYPVDKLVLLSAAAFYISPRQIRRDMHELIEDTFYGLLLENELYLRYKKKIMKTPISAAVQFRKLVTKHRPLLNKINTPTLIAQGLQDGIVPYQTAQYLYNQIVTKEKRVVWLDDCKHLICHCQNRDWLFKEILSFLQAERNL